MHSLTSITAILSLVVSAIGWGVVWGKTSQRLKTVEERAAEETARAKAAEDSQRKDLEVVKAERQDLAIAVARLEVKVDQLTQTLQSIREFFGKSVGINP